MSLKRLLSIGEVLLIIVLALIPIFASFPYRLNIFLSWEGAYRMYLGQTPYKDFGLPLGYMYWVIPGLFFKIFGAQMITLVKAQAFINILGGLAFRSIFRTLKVSPVIRFAGILVFCLSYSFMNYWPWYNHTVIMYELVALAFLMKYLFSERKIKWLFLALSGLFVFFSFFTKQDGGGLAFLVCAALLLYEAIREKKFLPLVVFVGSVLIAGLIMILPVSGYNFGYWFNHGQPPHTSRMSLMDIVGEFLAGSVWLKFYIFIIAVLLTARLQQGWKTLWSNRQEMIMGLLALGILVEAAIFQVTSYVPVDNNIFFHSFAIVYILYLLQPFLPLRFETWKVVLVFSCGVLLWWSHTYWKYMERFVLRGKPSYETIEYKGYHYAKQVDRNTYMINMDTTDIPLHNWRTVNLKSFEKMLLPGPTADGIERLMNMPLIKNGNGKLKVLNMTELTPLAAEVPFELEKGSYYPLWFHKGVGMFDKETDMFCDRIEKKHYDLVLFEFIPYLNNFYPYKVREYLEKNYTKVDSFVAPRKPTPNAWVEVWVKP
ncbi:MAG: hypothetical protein WCF67_09455 [Chitinophagaceae bacterium]